MRYSEKEEKGSPTVVAQITFPKTDETTEYIEQATNKLAGWNFETQSSLDGVLFGLVFLPAVAVNTLILRSE